MVTNSVPQVQAELKKEEQKELVKPTTLAENQKDPEPTNVQLDKK
jgi:hypothetical protein